MSDEPDRSVAGDQDTWILFDRQTADGYPLVVLARTGNPLIASALRESFIAIVGCRADPALIRDNGMPQHTDRLYPVEEALSQELEALEVGALHVASVTGDGLRRIVITHEMPMDFAPVLTRLKAEGYSLSEISADDRDEWWRIITPTEVEHQLNGDRFVISNIEKNGDDGTLPRKTDFWFYGGRQALDSLAAELASRGYLIDHWLDDAGLVLTTETSVDFATFQSITPILIESAARYGVTYDGWETLVIRREAELTQPAKPKSLFDKLSGGKKN